MIRIDVTLKYNKGEVPLYQIVVLYASMKAIPVACGFVAREISDHVGMFLYFSRDSVLSGIPVGSVISNKSPAISNVLKAKFPGANHISLKVCFIRKVMRRIRKILFNLFPRFGCWLHKRYYELVRKVSTNVIDCKKRT